MAVKKAAKKAAQAAKKFNALHNTTVAGLKASDRLGGIPAPSHAVLRADQPFGSYGDVSLVARREMVDPELGKSLFSADVYSRRQPKPLYRVGKKFNSPEAMAVKKAMKEFDDSHQWEFDDWLTRGDRNEFRASGSEGFMAAYARANGVEIPEPKNVLPKSERYNIERRLGELGKQYRDISSSKLDAVDNIDDWNPLNDPDLAPLQREMDSLKSKLESGSPMSAYDIRKLMEAQGVDPNGAEEWLFNSLVESGDWSAPYFNRGRKKVDYTAENLADYMNARTRGEEQTMVEGLGKQRSRSAKKFRSIEQARKHYESLVPADEMRAFAESTNEDLFRIADSVKSEYASSFQKLDDLSAAVGDVMKGASPQTALRRHGLSGNVDEELVALANRVKNGPTEYFESKFPGVADLGKYAGAVVPDNTPEDVIEMLQRRGLQVEKYPRGDEQARVAARNKIPGSAFMFPVAAVGAGLLASEDASAAESTLNASTEDLRAARERFKAMRQGKGMPGLKDAIATMASAVGGGVVGDLSRIGGYLNPFMPVERTEEGAQALEDKLQYIPKQPNSYLESIGRGVEQFEEDLRPITGGWEQSIPGQIYNRLPERVQGLLRVGADWAL